MNTQNINIKAKTYGLYSQKGLTLVEVLVATTLLTIGLLGVALMQVMSISGNTFSRETEVATELAQDMMERLKAMAYSDPALQGGVNHPTTNDVANGIAPAPYGDANNIVDEMGLLVGTRLYTRTWNVVDNLPTPGMKTITITVSWIDKNRQQLGLPNPEVTISGVKTQ